MIEPPHTKISFHEKTKKYMEELSQSPTDSPPKKISKATKFIWQEKLK